MLPWAFAFATSEWSSKSTVDSTPGIAPRVRSRRTSDRVSMPSMPITFARFRKVSRSSSLRKLLGRRVSSRTTNPLTCTAFDSASAAVVP